MARPNARQASQTNITKPKSLMPIGTRDLNVARRAEDYDEDDDDENWVSSGVATPDDREGAGAGNATPQTRPAPDLSAVPTITQSQQLPATADPVAGPSSVPTYDSTALENRLGIAADDSLRHQSSRYGGGFKTAPSSRPPSVRAKRHRGPPSLIRTSSFTPALNTTAPPLTTTSVANAQITSTNPPEDQPPTPTASSSPVQVYGSMWDGIAQLQSSPTSPTSSHHPQSRSAFLPARTPTGTTSSLSGFRPGLIRTPTQSSVSTLAAKEPQQTSPHTSLNAQWTAPADPASDSRNRKSSTFSVASGKLGAVTSGIAGLIGRGNAPNVASPLQFEHHGYRPSAAMSSLQAIPKRRDTPPPLTSHFPPESQLTHASGGIGAGAPGGIAFSLLPAPYMAAHMAVRAYEAPLQDAYARVVLSRPKANPSTSRS